MRMECSLIYTAVNDGWSLVKISLKFAGRPYAAPKCKKGGVCSQKKNLYPFSKMRCKDYYRLLLEENNSDSPTAVKTWGKINDDIAKNWQKCMKNIYKTTFFMDCIVLFFSLFIITIVVRGTILVHLDVPPPLHLNNLLIYVNCI